MMIEGKNATSKLKSTIYISKQLRTLKRRRDAFYRSRATGWRVTSRAPAERGRRVGKARRQPPIESNRGYQSLPSYNRSARKVERRLGTCRKRSAGGGTTVRRRRKTERRDSLRDREHHRQAARGGPPATREQSR